MACEKRLLLMGAEQIADLAKQVRVEANGGRVDEGGWSKEVESAAC